MAPPPSRFNARALARLQEPGEIARFTAVHQLRITGEVPVNTFEGTIKRATFPGMLIDGEIAIKDRILRVILNPYTPFAQGDRVFLHIPPDRCQVVN